MPTFPWTEYLKLSQNIVQNIQIFNNQESVYRCAISRTYYAVFCYSRNFAVNFLNFKPTGKGSDHTKVPGHFKDRGMVNIAFKLLDLRKWREMCDYQNNAVRDINTMSSNALILADYIINEISKIPH